MTKEQLVELGLNEEQIKEVFKLNGLAVENARGDTSQLEQELETLRTQNSQLTNELSVANDTLEELKGSDVKVTELKGKLTEYEESIETLRTEHTQELEKLLKTQKVTVEALNYEPHSVDDILTFVDLEKVDITDNGVFGLKEQIEAIKEEKPYLFKTNDPIDDHFKGQDPVDPINKGDGPKTYDDFLREQSIL